MTAPTTSAQPRLAFPRLGAWVSEAMRTALAHAGPLIAASIVIAIACATVLLTTGQTVAAEQSVLGRLDSMGTRVVTVSDNGGSAGMSSSSVGAVASMSTVSWAIGLGPVLDAHNSAVPADGTGVASRPVFGDLRTVVELASGRWPQPGEALASEAAAAALGLGAGIGGVTLTNDSTVPVVGTYRVDPTLKGLTNLVVIMPPNEVGASGAAPAPLLYLYAEAASIGEVDTVAASIPEVVTARQPSSITVETPEGLRQARETIASDLAASSRFLMLATLAISLAIVMVTMLAAVSERKQDFGRRRALGATRSAIVAMVLVHAVAAGILGVLVGVAAGLAFTLTTGGQAPPALFILGLAALAIIATALAAIPPALLAARRDPVRILRVP